MLKLQRRLRAALLSMACVACLAGCHRGASEDRNATEQAKAHAEVYFDELRNHQLDRLEAQVAPGVGNTDEIEEQLGKMAAVFPAGAPISVKVIGHQRREIPGLLTESVTLEYEFPKRWLVADVTTETRDGDALVTGIHVEPLHEPLKRVTPFELRGKGGARYAMLLLWVMAISITLFAFVICLRTKMERRKWLWLIFILLGAGRVVLNWTTNESSFQLIDVQVPPSMAYAAFYGPWILSVSFPLGAIVFLAKRRSLGGGVANDRD